MTKTNVRSIYFLAGLAALGMTSETAVAADDVHRLRIGAGAFNWQGKDSESTDKINQTSAVIGYTFGGSAMYFDIFGESAGEKKNAFGDGENVSMSQGAITLGKFLGDNASLFLTLGSRSFNETGKIQLDDGDDADGKWERKIGTLAVGGSYGWFIGSGSSVGISLAIGGSRDASTVTVSRGNISRSVDFENDGGVVSLGVDFSSRITDHVGYSLKLSQQNVAFKDYKLSDFDTNSQSLDESITRLQAYFLYDF